MSNHPTCQTSISYDENEVAILCGKPATHHIPQEGEYQYRETDTHLCEAPADEAESSGPNPVRRRREKPPNLG